MRLSIDHVTRYRFSAPQGRLVQMLRLRPRDSHEQTITSWRIDVDCDARLKPGRDGFGNETTMLYVEGAIERLEISVSGEVLTGGTDGLVSGTDEPLPPLLFLRATPLTRADDAIRDFALGVGGSDPLEVLKALNAGVHGRFAIDLGRPTPGLSAADAFALEAATPRDLAQMVIAAARSREIPARYVSGYALIASGDGTAPSPHGWVEAHVEGNGWIALDPCSGAPAGEKYVRVAVALDSAGATAVAGSRIGSGREELDVDVSVERLGGEE